MAEIWVAGSNAPFPEHVRHSDQERFGIVAVDFTSYRVTLAR
jgi:hypothetical protein